MVEERWIIFSKDQIWLSESMRLLTGRELNPALVAEQNVRTLKDAAGVCFRGTFLPTDSLPKQWHLLHLRQAFELLNDEEYKLACKLKELLHWDEVHQYCGHCAHPLATYTEISKRCPNYELAIFLIFGKICKYNNCFLKTINKRVPDPLIAQKPEMMRY